MLVLLMITCYLPVLLGFNCQHEGWRDEILTFNGCDSSFDWSFSCYPHNCSFVTIIWLDNNNQSINLGEFKRIYAQFEYRNNMYLDVSLKIRDSRKSDSGQYTCMIIDDETNQTLTTYMKSYHVIEQIIFDGLKNKRLKFGQNQTLECEAKFDSDAKDYDIGWQYGYGNETITNFSRYSIDNIRKENNVMKSTLTIFNVKKEDLGIYRCRANISVGSSSTRDYFDINFFVSNSVITYSDYMVFMFAMLFNSYLSSLIQ